MDASDSPSAHRGFKSYSIKGAIPGLLVLSLSAYFFICNRPGARLDFIMAALAPDAPLPEVAVKHAPGSRLAFRTKLDELIGEPLTPKKADELENIIFPRPRSLVKDDIEKGMSRAKAEGKLALINFTGFT